MATDWVRALTPACEAWTPGEVARRRASDAATIGSAVDAIGPGPVAWAVETAEAITHRFRDDGDVLGVPGASTGFSRQGAEVGLLVSLVAMAQSTPAEKIRMPPALAALARTAVRQGMPLDALIHKAWASHTAAQDALLGRIAALVPVEAQLAAVGDMSAAMFAYGNATVRHLTEVYREERRQWDGSSREERRRVILALARGGPVPIDAEAVLGLPLHAGHVFALAFSASARYVPRLEEAVTGFARDAAEALGAAHILVVPHDAAVQIWWSTPVASTVDHAALLRGIEVPPGVSIAVGPPGTGVAGFRTAFHGAHEAARLGRLADIPGVWDYAEIVHLSLMVGDLTAARRFVDHELAGLLGPGGRLADIRTTLRRYLETGNSRVAVARELHIAPSTVAYRVAQAGEILGPALRERPVPVLLALQLAHLVPELSP